MRVAAVLAIHFTVAVQTVLAVQELPVTGIVFAILIMFRFVAAAFAGADDFMFAVIVINHIATIERIHGTVKILIRILFHVGHHAAIQLIHILEPLRFQIPARLFTAHAARADGQHFFILE